MEKRGNYQGLQYHSQTLSESYLINPALIFIQAYLWEDNKSVVEWLHSQLDGDKWNASTLRENIKSVQRDYVIQQIRKYVASYYVSIMTF